jgi:long-chain fatty acid transport protein
VLVTLLVCGISAVSRSQGFQVNEIGSCAVARGLAVTGSPCKDPSNIYWNPAATASLEGWSAYVGMAAIAVRGGFTADTSRRTYDADAPVAFPANVFVNYGAKGGRWALGLGAYVPFGLTSQWSTDFPGRFEALRASLTSIYVQPNFAYRIARGWSIGGGPVIGYSQVQLRQSLDLAQQDAVGGITFGQLGLAARTEFARAKLAGSATAFGFNIGVHGELGPDWEVGARYLSSLDFHYNNADATFGQILTNLVLPAGNPLGVPGGTPLDGILSGQFLPGAALSAQHVSTRIKHPAQFQVGLGYSGFVNSRISGDFEWTQFSSFTALPVTFSGPASVENRSLIEDYTNSWSLRFGVEHAFPVGIKGRIGFSYVSSPAPDISVSPLIPDMNRRNYTIGFGVPLSPRYTLDAGYLHVNTSGRRGRVVENSVSTAGPVPDGGGNTLTAQDLNSGFYTLSANVLSLSIRANF